MRTLHDGWRDQVEGESVVVYDEEGYSFEDVQLIASLLKKLSQARGRRKDIDLRGHFPWPGVRVDEPSPGVSWLDHVLRLIYEYRQAVASETRTREDFEARQTPALRFSQPVMAAFMRDPAATRSLTPHDFNGSQPKTLFGCPVFTDVTMTLRG